MIDKSRRLEKERAKAKQRKRIHVEIDPDNYDYIPEAKQTSYHPQNLWLQTSAKMVAETKYSQKPENCA